MENATGRDLIFIREPDSIYQARGIIENGTFEGKWHFSFDQYYDRDYSHFGTLRVFNDDTLSPGATWPLHPHRNIEVVTYCAAGVFRHADENGEGSILRKGCCCWHRAEPAAMAYCLSPRTHWFIPHMWNGDVLWNTDLRPDAEPI